MSQTQLTKQELISQLAIVTRLQKRQVELVINHLPEVIQTNLDKIVVIPGIGRLKAVTRPARTAINPKTKEKIAVPAKQAIKFTPAKELKDSLNS